MTKAFNITTDRDDIVLTFPAPKAALDPAQLDALAAELSGDGVPITLCPSDKYLVSTSWVEIALPVAWLLSDEFSRAVIVHYANKIWDAFDRAMAKEYMRRKGGPRENVAPITHFDFSFRAADKVTYTHGTPRKGGAAKKVIVEGLIEIRIKSGGKPIDD